MRIHPDRQTAQALGINAMNQSECKNIMMCSSYLRYLIHAAFFCSCRTLFTRFTHFPLATKNRIIFCVIFFPRNISFFDRNICIILKCSLTWTSSSGTNYSSKSCFFSTTLKSSSESNAKINVKIHHTVFIGESK